MNFGDCPYDDCGSLIMFEVPDEAPCYALLECDECGRDFWYRFSRLDPQAWTREDFERTYKIDDERMTVELRKEGMA